MQKTSQNLKEREGIYGLLYRLLSQKWREGYKGATWGIAKYFSKENKRNIGEYFSFILMFGLCTS
ncbi:hypothetical protein BARBAKC583_0133 [Bartonella bacilliformis KC583]|uniref:Uncharacterized protein n=1 Tax=Bartonella bacilliformis (strain ATCC 35685 / KC583 / Herrer 020/F12,63) TaxID=360095 RepID=A1UR68_BARBK|nr:hypothetical protein BARBAKC583_0133 [Bartonella bacilliformis KC583]